jgi:hypothetical protein
MPGYLPRRVVQYLQSPLYGLAVSFTFVCRVIGTLVC